MIYLALYKGHREGKSLAALKARFGDWITRKITRGKYSHCEIAVDCFNGSFECYSSSIRDGGVRKKVMPLPSEKWDLVELPASMLLTLKSTFRDLEGRHYDWTGALGTILKIRQNPEKWFCSEFCAAVMGLPDGWRFSPNDLAAVAKMQKDGMK